MSDKALILGASDTYPNLGSTLQSCCRDMVSMYRWYGNNFEMAGAPFLSFMNGRYTKDAFIAGIRKLAANARILGIPISSHGTTIPINGVNHAAMVFENSDWNDLDTFGLDSDFAAVYREFPNTHFYVTADACESGPLAFKLIGTGGDNKFTPPPFDLQMEIAHNSKSGAVTRGITPTLPNVAYISGTGGKGFFSIDEGDGGAFTKHLTQLGKMSARKYAAALDASMDSQQQPEAHGGLIDSEWMQ